MRRPDRKPKLQPRLTAFLQPALKAPPTALANDFSPAALDATAGRSGGAHIKERNPLPEWRVERSVRNGGTDTPQESSEPKTHADLQQRTRDLPAEMSVFKTDSGGGFDKAAAAHKQQRSFLGKGSLEAFVKRQKIGPERDGSSEREVKRTRDARGGFGRAINGSAYAQCPLCTVQIPLTRMNHHLDIECVQRATCTPSLPTTFPLVSPPGSEQVGAEPDAGALCAADISVDHRPVMESRSCPSVSVEVPRGGANGKEMLGSGERATEVGFWDGRSSQKRDWDLASGGLEPNGEGQFENDGHSLRDRESGERTSGVLIDEVFVDFEVMPTLTEWLPGREEGSLAFDQGGSTAFAAAEGCEGRSGRGGGPQNDVRSRRSNGLRTNGFEEQRRGASELVGGGNEIETSWVRSAVSENERPPSRAPGQGEQKRRAETSASQERIHTSIGALKEPIHPHGQAPIPTHTHREPPHTNRHELPNTNGREPVRTPSPTRREPVHTLGMVRERGQRPLFGLSWAALQARQPSAPKGHYLVENFLTEEEEAHILASLDADVSNPWVTSRAFGDLNEGKAYGFVTDLRRRTITKPKRPMPPFLQSVLDRIRTVAPPLSNFVPNECNAISYRKEDGHWLRPHVDDRQLSGTIIAGVSLHSDCVMTYERERGRPEKFRVRLPRRCLQVQTQDSRYNFMHSIKNADLLGERRVSITFRQVAEPRA